MTDARFDVVVVGAGCAGLTAAVGLARGGFTVAVVEAAAAVGAAGLPGGVCFAEHLARPDLLGDEGVEALAWERRLVERGAFATDGRRLAGGIYRDPDAFRHTYTVLRPLFDAHLAQLALGHGAALLTSTTVEGLIRDGRRVVGVATTRGPLYADLVFLAEGDAGHLVSREGFDRSADPRDAPSFLYALQQVIDLPPGAVEDGFRVGPEQGVAYDLLLRNPPGVPLNARGMIWTNRQGLTLGVVLPAENLRRHFGGHPRRLLDWFADLPALRPWLRDGRRGAWSASLLRTGGLRDVPFLVEDGLAVGGAAAGLGADFPVLNETGPATLTGLLLSRAAARVRDEGGAFDRAALVRHYVEPLRQTRYWRDAEFLQRWPGYLRRTRVLFDGASDLLLDSAAVWGAARRWGPRKLFGWLRVLARVSWRDWRQLGAEAAHLGRALRWREVKSRPTPMQVVLDGALNAFRDLVRRPRPSLPPAGSLRVYFHAAGEEGRASAVPGPMRRWFERFRPVLASATRILCAGEDVPVPARLRRLNELLVKQVNLIDLAAAAGLAAAAALASTALAFASYPLRRLAPEDKSSAANAFPAEGASGQDAAPPAALPDGPMIRVVWRSALPAQQAESVRDLPHVCPADVFEVAGAPPSAVGVVVHAGRCVACGACWRGGAPVDWGRGGVPALRAPVLSPVVSRLLRAEDRAGLAVPAAPRDVDPPQAADPDGGSSPPAELSYLLDQLDLKLHEFEHALGRGPDTIDRPRGDHLEMLARYAQRLAVRIGEVLTQAGLPGAAALVATADERARRTWDGRYAWAAADGRLMRQHHLARLRRLPRLPPPRTPPKEDSAALRTDWITPATAALGHDACGKHLLADIAARRYLLETVEHALTAEQHPVRAGLLTALVADVREGLAVQRSELHTLPGDVPSATEVARPSVGETHLRGALPPADADNLRALLDVPGDWAVLAQRGALLAERAEIEEAERRLIALADDWCGKGEDEEIRAGFARQAAQVLAGKLLLLRTHARLEAGRDAELAVVLLRVWLDGAATRLDEFALAVRARLRPPRDWDRPLVEPGGDPPPRTLAEYLASPAPYAPGDFLLLPIDLLRPRMVPEMGAAEAFIRSAQPAHPPIAKPGVSGRAGDVSPRLEKQQGTDAPRGAAGTPEHVYLADALAAELHGRQAHDSGRALELEAACARLVLDELSRRGDALRERCVILRTLCEDVLPRQRAGGLETGVRHLGRDVLELEALKGDVRRRLAAAWEVFGDALGRNADVQASCFALAESAAWLLAADCALGRLAWVYRLCLAEDRDEPAEQQALGRRALAHALAVVRDRLFRFDEDLASLRRGYYAPHVRATALLLRTPAEEPARPPAGEVRGPLRLLVVVEPLPAVLPEPAPDGGRVQESQCVLGDADRAAVEAALRLRDAASEQVRIEAVAIGPPRAGQPLRELLSLGIDSVTLAVPRSEGTTAEGAAAALAAGRGPFDMVLGGAYPGNRLTALVAEALGVPSAGHAAAVAVRASSVCLVGATGQPPRERPLPAAVQIEAGTPLRPFTTAGFLAGLRRRVRLVEL